MASYHAATALGLEFTQPFHDKRVVELAFAIPQSLFVRGGRNRYLARNALGDLYPPELLKRGGGNDSRTPGFLEAVDRARAELLAESARLKARPKLARYFNFARIERILAMPLDESAGMQSQVRLRQAVRSIMVARYIEWVERDNLR